jgi:hypothetical protein
MNKEMDFDVVELGVASIETKGQPGINTEPQALFAPVGISDAE